MLRTHYVKKLLNYDYWGNYNMMIKFLILFTIIYLLRKRQFEYEGEDSRTNDPETNFYREYFLQIVDQGIISIQERFEQLEKHNNIFGFLYNLPNLKKEENDKIRKFCMDLHLALKYDENGGDINGDDLYEEIKVFCNIFCEENSDWSPLKCLQKIQQTGNAFPNLSICLRILLTIPVTTAGSERSFSKLKIIKNYLRSTITQERLSNLTLLSVEHKICENLNLNNLINEFAEIKARKIKLF